MALRWLAIGLLAAAMWGGEARASNRPGFGPPASWVDVAQVPDPPSADGGQAVQVLLDDNQSRLGPEGDAYYNRRVLKVLSTEGLSGLTTESFTWSPDTGGMTIHSIAIHRGDKTIDLLNGGKDVLVLRRETDLERAMLDGRLTATRQIEGLQVGDILDVSWTQYSHDPVLKGHSQDPEGIGFPGVAERYRVRMSWPSSEKVQWRATAGIAAPTLTTKNGRTELLLDATKLKAPLPPAGAPVRFQEVGRLDASSFQSWGEVSDLVAPLFEKAATLKSDSPIKAEAAAIAAHTTDPKARAFEALKLVEDRTRYFFVGTNDGGYVPADADETWRRKFGDCKGKTVLLLALLNELGVQAEPALVSTTFGDGLPDRLPSLELFDHVIVRASIGGKVYWLDGTREDDRGGVDALRPPPWRWVLPLHEGGVPLEAIVQTPMDQPMVEFTLHLDASKGLDAPATALVHMRMRGELTIPYRRMLARASKEDFERMGRQAVSRALSWIEPTTVTWHDNPAEDSFDFDVAGVADMDWRENTELHAREFKFPSNQTQTSAFPRREPGPNQDAPYVLPFPLYFDGSVDIVLPDGGKGFSVHGSDLDQTIAGYEIKRSFKLDGSVARYVSSLRTVSPEIPATVAEDANKALRRLSNEDIVVRQDLAAAGTGAHAETN